MEKIMLIIRNDKKNPTTRNIEILSHVFSYRIKYFL